MANEIPVQGSQKGNLHLDFRVDPSVTPCSASPRRHPQPYPDFLYGLRLDVVVRGAGKVGSCSMLESPWLQVVKDSSLCYLLLPNPGC